MFELQQDTVMSNEPGITAQANIFTPYILTEEELLGLETGDVISIDNPIESGYTYEDILIETIREFVSPEGENYYVINMEETDRQQLVGKEFYGFYHADQGWILYHVHADDLLIADHIVFVDTINVTFDSKTNVVTSMIAKDYYKEDKISCDEIKGLDSYSGGLYLTDNHADYAVFELNWADYYKAR